MLALPPLAQNTLMQKFSNIRNIKHSQSSNTNLGKISAQPHTIVKQIWQCIVFVIVFSVQELNLHNVVWGCAEILP